jgi:tyrosyl-tRNA synthetase
MFITVVLAHIRPGMIRHRSGPRRRPLRRARPAAIIRNMPDAVDAQLDSLRRGTEAIHSEDELRDKLAGDRPLRIKLGLDPTAPDIHLGHTVQLRKVRQFQDLGHKAIIIIGDYTAMIGDPSGRDSTRPVLSEEQIKANAQTYLDQAGLVLDTAPDKLEMRFNSEWLGRLDFADVLKLTGQMTVQQMLARENFKQRMARGRQIIVTEFMYPLMQAYDSVVIDADIEIGGTDQTFNCLAGRELMARWGKDRQVVMLLPLLPGLDGVEKMSKSKANYVGLTDTPDDMFGKVMSIPDTLMTNYFQLLTELPHERIASLTDARTTHPRQAKDVLGRMIVETFHSLDAARQASAEFRRRFAEGQLPTDMQTRAIDADRLPLAKLIAEAGFASSNSEARRLITQGAVSFAGHRIDDPTAEIDLPAEPVVLKVGKRRVCQVVRK